MSCRTVSRWRSRHGMNPKYPIYIMSKGRWEKPLTSRALSAMGVPHKLVVEPKEADSYREALGEDKVLVLPFGNLGQGSIPARNWIWDRAKEEGSPFHWVMDDNVSKFYRLQYNRRIPCRSGAMFRAAESFCERYENVAQAGLFYASFGGYVERREEPAPFLLNKILYSMLLIRTDIDMRWRGRYNEDTDLSLRLMKAGWVTVLFRSFMGQKMKTQTMKGGNTDTVYATGDHRREFADSLQRQHPDCVKVVWEYGRWHHHVNVSAFSRARLKLREGITPTGAPDEFGMRLRRVDKPKITVSL